MKCPHCNVVVHESWTHRASLGGYADGNWDVFDLRCPQCNRLVLELRGTTSEGHQAQLMVYPRGSTRPPPPQDVPDPVASDYREACLTLTDSPKASAALSRRCLQHLLREEAKVTPGKLSDEIGEAMERLPPYLANDIDAIRNVGNLAAHPTKDTNTGEIVDVEPGEAEWCLDVLAGLFEHYFVQPAAAKRKRDAVNAKLKAADRPPMK